MANETIIGILRSAATSSKLLASLKGSFPIQPFKYDFPALDSGECENINPRQGQYSASLRAGHG